MLASAPVIWMVAVLAAAGIVLRPLRWPEAVWAVAGAAMLVAGGWMTPASAWGAVAKGGDVYLFLAGMMLLSEVARREGLFDWLAFHALRAARGSTPRLFALIYLVAVAVTAILSNDATAVVMTPAVFAAAKKARVDPLPHLFVCAMVANAASFLLPISNPANLVVFAGHIPALVPWLARFLLPSLAAIATTFIALRFAERRRLCETIPDSGEAPPLSGPARVAFGAIAVTALVLLSASALSLPLGLPTAITGAVTALIVLAAMREAPLDLVRHIAWSILPLVAGLFVLVEAVSQTGVIALLAHLLDALAQRSETATAFGAGAVIALLSNLTNNLPSGLFASDGARPCARETGRCRPDRRRSRARTCRSPVRWRRSCGSPPSAAKAKTSTSGVFSKSAWW